MRALQAFGLCLAVIVGCVACGDDDGPPIDNPDAAVPIDGSPPCTEDDECSDGLFCNGAEACDEGQCVRGRERDCNDNVQCTFDSCSDSIQDCRHDAPDLDRDGHPDAECLDEAGDPLGDDCDDNNEHRFPSNREVCDPLDVDEDCDTATYGNLDNDGDGDDSNRCCNALTATTKNCGDDCDDGRESVHPGAAEICDELDNNCNGDKDEGVTVAQYLDHDHDGHGAEGSAVVQVCAGNIHYSADDDDCDDTRPDVHRAQLEICDTVDNDCDEVTDEEENDVAWYVDADGDGFGDANVAAVAVCVPPIGRVLLHNDCDDSNGEVNPGTQELCDAIDNDCNGGANFEIALNNFEDDDSDGSADFECGLSNMDCDDNNPTTSDGGIEICDGYDNDCDEKVDEDVPNTVWYLDADGDGFGDTSAPAVVLCAPLSGRTPFGGDCDDNRAEAKPFAKETCNGLDDDCDGIVDNSDDLREAGCTGQTVRITGRVYTTAAEQAGINEDRTVGEVVITIVHHTGATTVSTTTNSQGRFNILVPRGAVFVIAQPPEDLEDVLVGSAVPVNGPRDDIEILLLQATDLDLLAPESLVDSGLLIADIKGASHAGGQGVTFDPSVASVALVGETAASGSTLPVYDSQTWTPSDLPLPFTSIAAVDVTPGNYLLAPIGPACRFTEGNFFGNAPIFVQRWPVLANVITWVPIDCSPGLAATGGVSKCCEAHGGASCGNSAVAACVEASDPSCATLWDEVCVELVTSGGCSSCPATSSCFATHPSGGCDNEAVLSLINGEDQSACRQGPWSSTCVYFASYAASPARD